MNDEKKQNITLSRTTAVTVVLGLLAFLATDFIANHEFRAETQTHLRKLDENVVLLTTQLDATRSRITEEGNTRRREINRALTFFTNSMSSFAKLAQTKQTQDILERKMERQFDKDCQQR